MEMENKPSFNEYFDFIENDNKDNEERYSERVKYLIKVNDIYKVIEASLDSISNDRSDVNYKTLKTDFYSTQEEIIKNDNTYFNHRFEILIQDLEHEHLCSKYHLHVEVHDLTINFVLENYNSGRIFESKLEFSETKKIDMIEIKRDIIRLFKELYKREK